MPLFFILITTLVNRIWDWMNPVCPSIKSSSCFYLLYSLLFLSFFYSTVICKLLLPSFYYYNLPKSETSGLDRTIILGPIHSQKLVSSLRTSWLGGGWKMALYFPKFFLPSHPLWQYSGFCPQSRSDTFMSLWLKFKSVMSRQVYLHSRSVA